MSEGWALKIVAFTAWSLWLSLVVESDKRNQCAGLPDMQSAQSIAFCLPASDMLLISTDIQLEFWFIKKTVTDVGG